MLCTPTSYDIIRHHNLIDHHVYHMYSILSDVSFIPFKDHIVEK